MDFATVQSGLPTLFGTLMGVPCQWAAQPRRFVSSPCAVVDLLGIESIGEDESIVKLVDDAGAVVADRADATGIRETICGLRQVTIQVTAWSLVQQLGSSGRALLETLRTRLRWQSTIEALRAMGLALVTRQPIVQNDVAQNGRLESQASIDLTFAYGVAAQDARVPFIATARVRADKVRGAGGAEEPAQLQADLDVTGPES